MYGYLTANDLRFDEDGVIGIIDFFMTSLRKLEGDKRVIADAGGFSGESCTPQADVLALVALLSEIVVNVSRRTAHVVRRFGHLFGRCFKEDNPQT
jgi:hypothetical protein